MLLWLLLLPELMGVDIMACGVLIDEWSWPRHPPFFICAPQQKRKLTIPYLQRFFKARLHTLVAKNTT